LKDLNIPPVTFTLAQVVPKLNQMGKDLLQVFSNLNNTNNNNKNFKASTF